MPLSEHEQRVLRQLEESLLNEDPALDKKVRETTVYSHAGRRVRWGFLGFVLGMVILLTCFAWSAVLGLLGVAVMFGSGVIIERNIRLMGRASIFDLGLTRHARAATEGAQTGTPPWVRFVRRDRPNE
jgi:cytochrome c biogenesis protein ResB